MTKRNNFCLNGDTTVLLVRKIRKIEVRICAPFGCFISNELQANW